MFSAKVNKRGHATWTGVQHMKTAHTSRLFEKEDVIRIAGILFLVSFAESEFLVMT